MKAFTSRSYGAPAHVLKLEANYPKPAASSLGKDDVLIRQVATSVNAADWHIMRAEPFLARLAFGLFKPNVVVLGCAASGIVEQVGSNVSEFKVGDAVFGDLSGGKLGGFAEYCVAKKDCIVRKPESLSFQQAATIPVAATTALDAVKACDVKEGDSVLVTGATGGVGSFAVMISKARGASVTGVCGSASVEAAQRLGCDKVIDYRKEDYVKKGDKYDVIIDCAAYNSIWDARRALKPHGSRYAFVGGDRFFHYVFWCPLLSSSKQKFTAVNSWANLATLKEIVALVESGKLVPVVGREFPFSELIQAVRVVDEKHPGGKVVINM